MRMQGMTALVGASLARAYAGVRTALAEAEAGERPRPTTIAEVARQAEQILGAPVARRSD